MKDKTYDCKDCNKEFRVKAYTPEVVAMGLCPQCYTKRMTIIAQINKGKLNEINREKIDKAILEIKQLKIKYAKIDTMFICHALDEALKKIGWDYAILLSNEHFAKVLRRK